jgi:serine/threonine protein kinase
MNNQSKAREIFEQAIEIQVPDEQLRFVQSACNGDSQLLSAVQSLLNANQNVGGILETQDLATAGFENASKGPASEGGDYQLQSHRDSMKDYNKSEIIGPYKLLQEIGSGGMGQVWMAEQQKPVRRRVALKLIKAGMDTKLVIARFEAERQALALMDHPHIAKVFDAGTTSDGRPFFVMEYVRGKPITRFADDNHLTIPERLELFEQVCNAVQHAHHKGIIHRDLKPNNVIVSAPDGKPISKVIDFGIAKATSQQLTDLTLYTLHDQFIGTPQYMSPEQAAGSVDIDTRTDVYSLGVILFELLTGTTPFPREELQAVGLDAMKQIIIEKEPPKPSTRISLSEPTLNTLAASRKVEPKRLGLLVRGELDWIVMKALDKDRSRRYETPNSFSEDIFAYLKGEPIDAAPPSQLYRLQKFTRRNKTLIAVSASFLIAVTLGIVGLSWGLMESMRSAEARKESLEIVAAERDAKEHALTLSEQRLLTAEQNLFNGIIRTVGFDSDTLQSAELNALNDWSRLDLDSKIRVLSTALSQTESSVRIARRSQRVIAAISGETLEGIRELSIQLRKEYEKSDCPKTKAAICRLAIEMGATRDFKFETAVEQMVDAKQFTGDDVALYLAAISHQIDNGNLDVEAESIVAKCQKQLLLRPNGIAHEKWCAIMFFLLKEKKHLSAAQVSQLAHSILEKDVLFSSHNAYRLQIDGASVNASQEELALLFLDKAIREFTGFERGEVFRKVVSPEVNAKQFGTSIAASVILRLSPHSSDISSVETCNAINKLVENRSIGNVGSYERGRIVNALVSFLISNMRRQGPRSNNDEFLFCSDSPDHGCIENLIRFEDPYIPNPLCVQLLTNAEAFTESQFERIRSIIFEKLMERSSESGWSDKETAVAIYLLDDPSGSKYSDSLREVIDGFKSRTNDDDLSDYLAAASPADYFEMHPEAASAMLEASIDSMSKFSKVSRELREDSIAFFEAMTKRIPSQSSMAIIEALFSNAESNPQFFSDFIEVFTHVFKSVPAEYRKRNISRFKVVLQRRTTVTTLAYGGDPVGELIVTYLADMPEVERSRFLNEFFEFAVKLENPCQVQSAYLAIGRKCESVPPDLAFNILKSYIDSIRIHGVKDEPHRCVYERKGYQDVFTKASKLYLADLSEAQFNILVEQACRCFRESPSLSICYFLEDLSASSDFGQAIAKSNEFEHFLRSIRNPPMSTEVNNLYSTIAMCTVVGRGAESISQNARRELLRGLLNAPLEVSQEYPSISAYLCGLIAMHLPAQEAALLDRTCQINVDAVLEDPANEDDDAVADEGSFFRLLDRVGAMKQSNFAVNLFEKYCELNATSIEQWHQHDNGLFDLPFCSMVANRLCQEQAIIKLLGHRGCTGTLRVILLRRLEDVVVYDGKSTTQNPIAHEWSPSIKIGDLDTYLQNRKFRKRRFVSMVDVVKWVDGDN